MQSSAQDADPPAGAEVPPGLAVRVSADHMAVHAKFTEPMPTEAAILALRGQLQKLGFTDEALLDKACVRLVHEMLKDAKLEETIVMEGTRPVLPLDGEIVWEGEYFKEGFVTDPKTDVVCYRLRAANPNVRAGQHLATISLPEAGIPGVDLFGKAVPVRAPRAAHLRAGKGMRFSEETREFFATADGRVRLNRGTVVVDTEFDITGSVGLKTGNLRHPGAVHVHGDIEAGSQVEAEGEIRVNGSIEDAVIVAGGDILVDGGIAGGKHCHITAAGNIQARFMENACIEAGGDVQSAREIQHCVINARGAVRSEAGRVFSCEIVAMGGIVVREVGTEADTPTSLTAGEDIELQKQTRAMRAEAEEIGQRLRQMHAKIDPLRGHEKQLNAHAREAMQLLLFSASEMEQEIEKIHAEIARMEAESRAQSNAEIIVLQAAWPDSVFRVDDQTLRLNTYLQGPVRIVPGPGGEPDVQAYKKGS